MYPHYDLTYQDSRPAPLKKMQENFRGGTSHAPSDTPHRLFVTHIVHFTAAKSDGEGLGGPTRDRFFAIKVNSIRR
jgi:hypothetical protein